MSGMGRFATGCNPVSGKPCQISTPKLALLQGFLWCCEASGNLMIYARWKVRWSALSDRILEEEQEQPFQA
jgi:hypothetical protein